jgi:pyruvate/2-oxoglutarate dehydrogenase complex dihydrolipoamide acyltransferase (E2) component
LDATSNDAQGVDRKYHPLTRHFPDAGGRVIASPYAKKLAREAGVDISQATGTGPGGRIVAADVQKLISSGGGKPAEAAATTEVCAVLCFLKHD